MAAPVTSSSLPFYLRGNFAPVMDEVTAIDLPVTGAIPPELRGTYLRNGPNPKSGTSHHWFSGDGMVHGVRLEHGRASWYRNRWVQTRVLREDARLVDDAGNVDHTVAVANTNVIGHAGRIFALVESSFPTELGPTLDTRGVSDFEGRLTTSMTAHPKPCPTTGELHFFGYRFFPPYLTYHRLDAAGRLVVSREVAVPGPTMIHDFAITARYVIFMDLPVVFSPVRALEGTSFPYEWSDFYGARLGVLPRAEPHADVRWFEIAPCYVFHPLNAYEDGDALVLDVVRYPDLWRGGPDTFTSASLHRFTIDLAAGRVGERPLDDRPVEFPRVDDRRMGLRHRYAWMTSNTEHVGEEARELVRYDLATGATVVHDFGAARSPSEGVFVPAGPGSAEDEGWVMQFVYDRARNASDLVLLDASSPSAPPVAAVHLPQRVPYGFHGNWIPDRA